MLSSLLGLAGGVGSGGTAANPGKSYGATATTGPQQTGPITPTVNAYGGGVDLGPKIELTFPGGVLSGQPSDINPPVAALAQPGNRLWLLWLGVFGIVTFSLFKLAR